MMKRSIASFIVLCIMYFQMAGQAAIPPKGSVFNESEWTVDSLTGRKTLRLTSARDFNQTPTYHINTAFSGDSRYFIFATWNRNGQSALIKANTANGDLTVVSLVEKGESGHFNGNNICMIPATEKAAAVRGGKVYVYDLNTFEEKLLMTAEDGFTFGHPAGSADGKKIYVNRMPRYTQGKDDPYKADTTIYYSIDISTAKASVFFTDSSRSNHTVVCPSNPDLLLLDRDFPPKYGSGSDNGRTSRVWLLNMKTGKLTEIRPQNKNRFQIHSNWSFDGRYVYYHGVSEVPSPKGGFRFKPHFIGVADQSGKVIWEKIFPNFNYGHICSHTTKHAIITDGLIFSRLITEINWKETDNQGVPVINVLGAHNSGDHSYGQQAHPHCLMSPDGKLLSYNKGNATRSDVYILTLD